MVDNSMKQIVSDIIDQNFELEYNPKVNYKLKEEKNKDSRKMV